MSVYGAPGQRPGEQRMKMSIEELRLAWNAQADAMNQWDELGLDEIVDFAQEQMRKACAMKGCTSPSTDDIGGVLSYRTSGRRIAGGQLIGANGAGQFCVIFVGSHDHAEEMAREHIRSLERCGHMEIDAIFTPNDDLAGYNGNPMTVVTPSA